MRRGSGVGKKHETPPPSPSKRPKRAVTEDDAASALRETESEGMAANLAKLAKFNERNSRSRSKGHAAAAVASFSQEPALQAPASQAPALQAPATQAAARSIGELQQLANSFKTPTSTAECVPTPAAFLHYISKHVVVGEACPPAQDEGFLIAHRHLVAVGDLPFAPEEPACPGCPPCVFGCDVLSVEEAALMGIMFQGGSVVCE
jgi:hypothetical protein